ncbi:hypothetical protein ACHQM5_014978 [Ranunculus cassubicifolius]
MHLSIILLCIYLILFSTEAGAVEEASKYSLGVIVDYGSRVGKEQIIGVKMAIEDYYKYTINKPVLHFKDSGHDPVSMTISAINIISQTQVDAVLLSMLDDLDFVAELGSKAEVPILSLSNTTPLWVFRKWPFLIQATRKNYKQMRAVAAIVGIWQWRSVNVIYEDISSARLSIFPHLVDALNEVGSNIENFLAIPPFNVSISNELQKLVHHQSRVFIVHTSLSVANSLFEEAKKMGLMERESVWIVTNAIADLLDTVDASVTSNMQGVLGVKTYFPHNSEQFNLFKSRFRIRFRSEHPEEEFSHPGIFALQAYDAAWAVARALEGRTMGESLDKRKYLYGKKLLDEIILGHFDGLAGEFNIVQGELPPSRIFEIVNVLGKSYRQLGHWTDGHGLSVSIDRREDMATGILQHVLWPGGQWKAPRGWSLPTSEYPLKIGVPYNPESYVWINVVNNSGGKPIVNGFCIEVFQAILNYLPYYLTYEYISYDGTYDSLVNHVFEKVRIITTISPVSFDFISALVVFIFFYSRTLRFMFGHGEQRFDAVVGDTAIIAARSKHVEFSQPWSDSGIQMVVSRKSVGSGKAWLFFKPYSTWMWVLTAGVAVYTGLIVWLMEGTHHSEFNDSAWNKVGAPIWLGFTSFFSLHGDRLHNNLTRVVMAVWFFVAIIIVQSYTASLSSILTVPHYDTRTVTVDSLRMSNAKVGCDRRSFVVDYLHNVLNFSSENIIGYDSKDEYAQALISGEIVTAFLEVPYIKVFLAKFCNNFTVVGDIFNVGGFGLAFPKGSPMLPDINRAILQVKEHGKLQDLEESLINAYNCSDPDKSDEGSMGVNIFWGLFVITGGTSTVALTIHLLHSIKPSEVSIHDEIVEHDLESPRTDTTFQHGHSDRMIHNGPNVPATTQDCGNDHGNEGLLTVDITNEDPHVHLEERNNHP